MIHPGYLLNPGDMFEVEPERVLYALGASKDAAEREATRSAIKRKTRAAPTEEATEESESSEAAAPEPATELDPADAEKVEKKKRKQHKDNLQALLADARSIIEDTGASAKKKQRIRAFAATVRRSMGNARKTSVENLDTEIEELVAKLSLAESKAAPEPVATPTSADPSMNAQIASNMRENIQKETRPEDKQLLIKALREIRENPIDPSKPYATPWRPRPFLPAFAFVPRYLEVNHNICSAVYLRHPVARPGLGEVPTPFPLQTMGLSYNWYLRRGR